MAEERNKKIQHRINILTFGIIALLAVFLLVLAMTRTIDTILFPVGAGIFLTIYWVIVDVLPVVWLHSFEEKTYEQKRSYCFYAIADAAGLAGLIYFIMNMSSITGALIYVASMFLKKRFHDEYLGVNEEESAETPDTETMDAAKQADELSGEGEVISGEVTSEEAMSEEAASGEEQGM